MEKAWKENFKVLKYDKLFKKLEENNVTTYVLRKEKVMGQQTYYNLKNGGGDLSGKSIDSLCRLLNCQPGDLMEYVQDPAEVKE